MEIVFGPLTEFNGSFVGPRFFGSGPALMLIDGGRVLGKGGALFRLREEESAGEKKGGKEWVLHVERGKRGLSRLLALCLGGLQDNGMLFDGKPEAGLAARILQRSHQRDIGEF